jgi:hypothetical protein
VPTLVANLLLVVAAFVLLPNGMLVAEARPVSGPDAMGLIVVPLFLGVQWLALTGALLVAAWHGGLAWVHRSRAVQAVVGTAWLAVSSGAGFAAMLEAFSGQSARFAPWAFALTVVVPACVVVALAVCVNAAAGPRSVAAWRVGAGVASVVVACGAVTMWWVDREHRLASEAAQAEADAAHARWLAEQRRRLTALAPDAPLRDWLPWLDAQPYEFSETAIAAVRARPTLERDLTEMLRGPDAPRALRFMWLWMAAPPAGLAAPTRDAIATLPAWADAYLTHPPTPVEVAPDDDPVVFPPETRVDPSDMAQAAIVLADAFRGSGLDFVTPIRAFQATLQRHALPEAQLGEDETYQARGFLETWLSRR